MNLLSYWRRLALWPKMALAISFGFLTLYGAFSLLGEWAIQDSSQRILKERLIIAEMAAGQIDQWLQEEIDELEQAHFLGEFKLNDPVLTAEADFMALTFTRLNEFSPGFSLIDDKGHVILSRPEGLYFPGADLSHHHHVVEALTRRKATISEPFLDPLSQSPVAALTVPIYQDDRFVGLLSGLVDFDRLEVLASLTRARTLGETGHAVLVDHEGLVLASTLGLPFLSPGEHHTFYQQAMHLGQPVVDTVPFELDLPDEPKDHRHVMAFAPLAGVPWGVFVGGDYEQTFSGVYRLRRGLIALGLLTMMAVWGGTLVGARRLVQPIQQMTQAAQKIAAGDLQSPIEGVGGVETEVMAMALEDMRKKILNAIEDLTNLNQTLEDRVDERTTHLRQEQAMTRELLGRIMTAQEEERTRVSRELHDELGQILTAIQINLDSMARSLSTANQESHTRIEQIRRMIEEAITGLRHLITALRPSVLDNLGLIPAIRWVAEESLHPLNIGLSFEVDGSIEDLSPEIETTLFRITQEAINNIARHSMARAVAIQVRRAPGQIELLVNDNGRGWDQAEHGNFAQDLEKIGLATMQERAGLVGGSVKISSGLGNGTTILVSIPLRDVSEDHFVPSN